MSKIFANEPKYFFGDELCAIHNDMPIRVYVLGEYVGKDETIIHCISHLPVPGYEYPPFIKLKHNEVVKTFHKFIESE